MKPRTLLGGLVALTLPLSLQAATAADPVVPTVEVAAVGDFSAGTTAGNVLSSIGGRSPDLALALGDLSYGTTGAEQAWCDFVTARVGAGFPFELVSGNHESNGQNGNINDFAACLPNQLPGAIGTYGRQYYVDYPASAPLVRFVMISPGLPFADGTWDYSAGGPRYQWTAAAIDGARSASIPWVVVGLHKPCISIGQYGCDPGADILNLLVGKRVDLVLNGHDHSYQRSRQVALGAGCAALVPGTFTPACVVDGDSDLDKGAGTVWASVGTGGVSPLHNVTDTDPEAGYIHTSAGLNRNPSWGWLSLSLTADRLSANFVPVAGALTDAFSMTKRATPVNQAPTASFTTSCTGLTCDMNGAASSDVDGTITDYAWSFGDGATTSGASPTSSHTYAAGGTYTVGLTVTDNLGATATTTRSVTVTSAAAPPTASDDFARTVASGWGSATVGGPWTVSLPSAFSVNGRGQMVQAAGRGLTATLEQVSKASTTVRLTMSFDKVASGSGVYVSVMGRKTSAGQYRVKWRVTSNGSLSASLVRTTATGAETALLGERVIPGVTVSAGSTFATALEVTGTNPTTIRAKAWPSGAAEPTTWSLTTSDATTGLQAAGSVGVYTYLSSSATNAPIMLSLDDLLVPSP